MPTHSHTLESKVYPLIIMFMDIVYYYAKLYQIHQVTVVVFQQNMLLLFIIYAPTFTSPIISIRLYFGIICFSLGFLTSTFNHVHAISKEWKKDLNQLFDGKSWVFFLHFVTNSQGTIGLQKDWNQSTNRGNHYKYTFILENTELNVDITFR